MLTLHDNNAAPFYKRLYFRYHHRLVWSIGLAPFLKNTALLCFAFYKSGNDFGAWLKENNVALASAK
jgi:hypothetical protein